MSVLCGMQLLARNVSHRAVRSIDRSTETSCGSLPSRLVGSWGEEELRESASTGY
jgi:hypothetical protein